MPTPIPITSTQNPHIKQVVKLHQMRECDARGEFLFEGTHALIESLAAGWNVTSVYFTSDWIDRNSGLQSGLASIPEQYVVSHDILKKMATTPSPDGVVAVGKLPSPMATVPSFRLGIAVDALQDPGNLGALQRSAVACGADEVFVGAGSVAVHHPKVVRASAGQWFRRPPKSFELKRLIDACKPRSIRVFAAVAGGIPVWDIDLTQPSLILLGNEGAGLDHRWIEAADARIGVPMATGVESLNVAMTGTMILYEAMRQRTVATTSAAPSS